IRALVPECRMASPAKDESRRTATTTDVESLKRAKRQLVGGIPRWYQAGRQAAQLFRFYRAFSTPPFPPVGRATKSRQARRRRDGFRFCCCARLDPPRF